MHGTLWGGGRVHFIRDHVESQTGTHTMTMTAATSQRDVVAPDHHFRKRSTLQPSNPWSPSTMALPSKGPKTPESAREQTTDHDRVQWRSQALLSFAVDNGVLLQQRSDELCVSSSKIKAGGTPGIGVV